MGKISNSINHYLSDNRRFADLFNGICFQGETVIRAEDLLEASQVYHEIIGEIDQTGKREKSRKRRERIRDICKLLKTGETLRVLALENQEMIDYSMPFRCMQYDVMEYGKQLDTLKKKNRQGSNPVTNGLTTMAEKFCGLKIRDRIEAIARFKKYPAGMGLVSVCAIIVLTFSLVIGVQASGVYDSGSPVQIAMASARSTPCTTPAGAFDTYAKAVLDQNGVYRAMCAPVSMQADITNEIYAKNKAGVYPNWDCGLNEWPATYRGYYIYNLKHIEKNIYEGLLVIQVNYPPDGQAEEEGKIYLAVQNLRAWKEDDRWITVPLEDFRSIAVADRTLEWGCSDLPGITYSGTASDIQIDVNVQTIHYVDGWVVENDVNYFMFGPAHILIRLQSLMLYLHQRKEHSSSIVRTLGPNSKETI